MLKLLSNENSDKKEYSKKNSLALKGIAIIMMMIHHCFRATHLFKGFNVSFYPLNQDQVIALSLFFKICICIFVFITGYGLAKSYRSKNISTGKQNGHWLVDRLIKMLSGFWIVAIISMIVCQLINGRTAELFFQGNITQGIVSIITNISGLAYLFDVTQLNPTWWYMSIAIIFVLMIPILIKIIDKYGYTLCGLLIIVIPRLIGKPYSGNSFEAYIFMLYLGILFSDKDLLVKFANLKIYKENQLINKLFKFIIEACIIVFLYLLYSSIFMDTFREISLGIIPLFVIMFLYEFFIDIPILNKIFEFLGKHSMNIFLVHTFIRDTYLHEFIYSRGNFMACAMTLLLISLGISIIIELFKKIIRYDKFIEFLRNKVSLKEG